VLLVVVRELSGKDRAMLGALRGKRAPSAGP
jgi:hypothetical protein